MIIEEALACFLNPDDPRKAYDLARSYAEKYNSSYGSGLIPESLAYLRDIIYFWENYFEKMKMNQMPI